MLRLVTQLYRAYHCKTCNDTKMAKTLAEVSRTLKNEYSELSDSGGWRAVGSRHGISGGMAYRIVVDGYNPRSPTVRAKLGLPSIVPTPACPNCGQVHVAKRCPHLRRDKRDLWSMSKTEILKALGDRYEIKA